MKPLKNPVRHYAWGSRTAIPELLAVEADGSPQAELWLGAHESGPSLVVDSGGERPLDEVVRDAPAAVLGADVLERFGARVPYLLKVLAADRPLSLQVHPSSGQAADGWAVEQRSGVPMDAPHRRYKDDQHKPELVLALTRFEALCGFRDPKETAELLEGLGVPEVDVWRDQLAQDPSAESLRAVFTEVLGDGSPRPDLVRRVADACAARLRSGSPYPLEDATVVALASSCPGDPGVLVSLLLHRVSLAPGEALFLAAGNIHAHLRGTAVELMACSDNVLRGGLTEKHVDIPELLRVVDFTPSDVPYVVPAEDGGCRTWRTPAEEFELSQVVVRGETVRLSQTGPRILLCLDGAVELAAGQETLPLRRGESAFVPASDGPLEVHGHGDLVLASVPGPFLG
ncbi:MAG: mannose-6-phosphate isomerase, class I [Actinomycetes bacterium]